MTETIRIAVIEDDPDINELYASHMRALETPERKVVVDQLLTRDKAEAALAKNRYDLISLDIEMNYVRSGIGIAARLKDQGPVVVVSGLDADIYEGVMRELEVWDYIRKPVTSRAAFLEVMTNALRRGPASGSAHAGAKDIPLEIDPLNRTSARWRGERINLPLTGQRVAKLLIDRPGQLVTYDELFAAILTGKTKETLRQHISKIREAIETVEEGWDGIQSVPGAGYLWRA